MSMCTSICLTHKMISSTSTITPELIISIGILIFTAASVLIAYAKLKPGLHVQVLSCKHHVVEHRNSRRKYKEIGTQIEVKFKILNTGVKTSIDEVGINCKISESSFQTSEKVKSRSLIIIEKGGIAEYTHQFYLPNHEVTEMLLLCTFFLHHTYGKKKVETKSNFNFHAYN